MKEPKRDMEYERWLDEIVNLSEAAALRKIAVETLRSEIKAGRLRVIELSKRRRGMTRREALRGARP